MAWVRVKQVTNKPWLVIYKDDETGKTQVKDVGLKETRLAQPYKPGKPVGHKIRKDAPPELGDTKAIDNHKYRLERVDLMRALVLKLAQDRKRSGEIKGYRIEKSNYGYELWVR